MQKGAARPAVCANEHQPIQRAVASYQTASAAARVARDWAVPNAQSLRGWTRAQARTKRGASAWQVEVASLCGQAPVIITEPKSSACMQMGRNTSSVSPEFLRCSTVRPRLHQRGAWSCFGRQHERGVLLSVAGASRLALGIPLQRWRSIFPRAWKHVGCCIDRLGKLNSS